MSARSGRVGEVGLQFAERVQAERLRRGMSQRQLGALLGGVKQQRVTLMESGAVSIPVDLAYALVNALWDGRFPDLDIPLAPCCEHCHNDPPRGFTCDYCKKGSVA